MDAALQNRLTGMTRDFYRHHAEAFSRTRQNPWASWQGLVELAGTFGSVIDYGCGNGRFAGFLDGAGIDCRYLGVDSDEALLAVAATTHRQRSFRIATDPRDVTERADLVVCFGVMHHIPDDSERAAFVCLLVDLASPGGIVAISFWQPEHLTNFASKTYTDHGVGALDRGDHLLGWNGDFTRLRYCHHFEDSEIGNIVAQTRASEVARFSGTGNDATNRYVLLRR